MLQLLWSRINCLSAIVVASIVCLLLIVATPTASADSAVDDGLEKILVGTFVNGVEQNTTDVLRQGSTIWIHLDDVEQLLGVRISEASAATTFETPIGSEDVDDGSLFVDASGERWVNTALLFDYLRVEATFNSSLFAIVFQVPWNATEPFSHPRASPGEAGDADFGAPPRSLYFLRIRSDYHRQIEFDQSNSYQQIDTGGRLGDGSWVVGAERDNSDDAVLNQYFYTGESRRAAFRLGTNYVNLNPLMNASRFTGGQLATSNHDVSDFTDVDAHSDFDNFIKDDLTGTRDFSGTDGPRGGIAELRINDRVIARVRVGLDGYYSFRNLPVRTNDYHEIQVFLYRQSVFETPLATIDYSRQLVDQMLDKNRTLLRAGYGEAGNPLDDNSVIDSDSGGSGFVLLRHGLSENLTLQAATQRPAGDPATHVLGLRSSLGEHWALALDGARRDDSEAFSGEWLGRGRKWDASLRQRYFGADYDRGKGTDRSRYDHVLRTIYQVTPNFRAGLVGRAWRNQTSETASFLKPAMFWQVRHDLYLTAQPNLDGRYRYSADYTVDYRRRLTSVYENDLYSVVLHDNRSDNQTTQAGYERNTERDRYRVFAQSNWYLNGGYDNQLQVGVSHDRHNFGWWASWNRIITGGVELQAQYYDNYRNLENIFSLQDEGVGRYFTLRLRMDFAGAGSRLVSADQSRVNLSRGGIAGRIASQSGASVDVKDAKVRVNGALVQQSAADGYFYVANLRPGVYSVSLDEENLPIEYTADNKSFTVAVGRSAVTNVDVTVTAQYAVAGRVVDAAGEPVVGARIAVSKARNDIAGIGVTGQFGYYRVDGLVPGDYTATVTHIDDVALSNASPSLPLTIVDQFLFEKNFTIHAN